LNTRAIIEMLFSEGNHFCPACEKSGNCELQALALSLQYYGSPLPYQFPSARLKLTRLSARA
jgi:[NiFe] hydrogenase diaphorase moiety small subunit